MNPPTTLCGFRVREYRIPIAGVPLRLLGPDDPDRLLDDPRTEERFHAEDEHLPYWATPWAAAVMLADHLAQLPPGRGRRALEIGCGLGLAGLAAARCGWQVWLTDYEPDALDFARASAALNDITTVEFARLDWRRPSAPLPCDLILAADVLFEERWVEPVADFIAANLGPAGALVCDPNRRAAVGFAAALERRGLWVDIHETMTTEPDAILTRGRIYSACARHLPQPDPRP